MKYPTAVLALMLSANSYALQVSVSVNNTVLSLDDNTTYVYGDHPYNDVLDGPTDVYTIGNVSEEVRTYYGHTVMLSNDNSVTGYHPTCNTCEINDTSAYQSFAKSSHMFVKIADGDVYSKSLFNGVWREWSANGRANDVGDYVEIQTGSTAYVALTDTGKLVTWGTNEQGMLGRGSYATYPGVVTAITNPVIDYHVTDYGWVALDDTGTVWTAGDNAAGKLATGDKTGSSNRLPTPTLIQGAIKVQTGNYATGVLTSSGELFIAGKHGLEGATDDVGQQMNYRFVDVSQHIEGIITDFVMYRTTTFVVTSTGVYVHENYFPKRVGIQEEMTMQYHKIIAFEQVVEEACPVPTETLSRLHYLKTVRYEEKMRYVQLVKQERKRNRRDHRLLIRSVHQEMKVLRMELNALREAGCAPHRHKYWRDNGMEFNRFEFNHKKRRASIVAARKANNGHHYGQNKDSKGNKFSSRDGSGHRNNK